jgi:hypothetical protein
MKSGMGTLAPFPICFSSSNHRDTSYVGSLNGRLIGPATERVVKVAAAVFIDAVSTSSVISQTFLMVPVYHNGT